jgi:hypothetical protein
MNLMELKPIDHPAGWRGEVIRRQGDWIYHLSVEERSELEEVGARFLADDPDLRRVQAADYPLPRTRAGLARWTADLDDGRGFVLVRGLRSEL